jgi:catechol 2,3-dioxygenase-like lactoylglutathione lyase family enzyme
VKRPHILGISHVQIYVTNATAEKELFSTMAIREACSVEKESSQGSGYRFTGWCEWLPKDTLLVNTSQTIGISDMPQPVPKNLLAKITFATDNVPELRRYMVAHGITPSKRQKPDLGFTVVDPEGRLIGFRQVYEPPSNLPLSFLPLRLIHAGFVVHDRAATDHFYKDILGFRPYWHGGMKDDKDDWVAMQVPDGTDWVEYMLNISPTADKHTLGVMNHIALGVPDIQAAKAQLIKNGWKPGEEPKMGRDGKWQLNLYDPDDTRVEFMEFTPKEKPCCSEFTGPHPGPKQ